MVTPVPLKIDRSVVEEILNDLTFKNVEYIRFEQTDTHGTSRSKTVPVRHFKHFALSGLNFLLGQLGFDVQSGVAMGTGYLEDRGFPDSRIFPDLHTVKTVPWATIELEELGEVKAERTARVICEPYFQDGTPAMASPRAVARALLGELEALGYGFFSGFEYENYFVDAETRQPPFPGIQIFSTLRNNFDPDLIGRILREMSQIGVDIITSNSEYGPGQMEINFGPAKGIDAADIAFTFKNGVKEIAQQHGYMASFMTKPYADQSANGCHYHHSLTNLKTGTNAFSNPDDPTALNDICRWWIGGQIKHATAFCAFAAPTINCYKRYKQWSFAPTNATWGFENRTVGFRIKGLRGEGAHVENRIPGGASNPYLVMAATIAAGLDGLRNKIEPPAATTGIAYGLTDVQDLPVSLPVALDALEADTALRESLGEELVKLYVAVKRHEIKKAADNGADVNAPNFNDIVTPFEVSEYFEFL
ncbi:MAG: glutamine synthetase [Anaerolineae bacterium]|nr:glutamine synthetase [Anaerolineae bacterium]